VSLQSEYENEDNWIALQFTCIINCSWCWPEESWNGFWLLCWLFPATLSTRKLEWSLVSVWNCNARYIYTQMRSQSREIKHNYVQLFSCGHDPSAALQLWLFDWRLVLWGAYLPALYVHQSVQWYKYEYIRMETIKIIWCNHMYTCKCVVCSYL
jgi:hypothetical protein